MFLLLPRLNLFEIKKKTLKPDSSSLYSRFFSMIAPFPIYSQKFMRSSVNSLMGNGNAFFAFYGDRAISKHGGDENTQKSEKKIVVLRLKCEISEVVWVEEVNIWKLIQSYGEFLRKKN